MLFNVRYIHKISPRDTDVAGPVELRESDFANRKTLAAALRKAKVLSHGERIRDFRIEVSKDQVVVFPQASIWWSIVLTPAGSS